MINRKSFLIKSFEEYHQIIFKYRKRIKESSLFSQTDTDDIKVHKSFVIQSEIISFIKAKSAEILYETGKIGESIFDEVSYVMASLADEIFIVLNWDGKDYWKNNLIEQQLFHSQNAGEVVFNKISAVLQDQSMESSELALIYFYCLALGFQGAKRSLDDCEKQIQELKAKLYYKIYYKDSKLFKEKLSLFPKSYDFLFAEKNILFDNPLIFWKKIFVFSIVAYFIFVEFLWNYKMKIVFNLFSGCIGG